MLLCYFLPNEINPFAVLIKMIKTNVFIYITRVWSNNNNNKNLVMSFYHRFCCQNLTDIVSNYDFSTQMWIEFYFEYVPKLVTYCEVTNYYFVIEVDQFNSS